MQHGLAGQQYEEDIAELVAGLRLELATVEAGIRALRTLREAHYYTDKIAAAKAAIIALAKEGSNETHTD